MSLQDSQIDKWLDEVVGPPDEQLSLWHGVDYPFAPGSLGSGSTKAVGHTELCEGAELSRDCERSDAPRPGRSERSERSGQPRSARNKSAVQQETTD